MGLIVTYQPDNTDLRVKHLTEEAIRAINDLIGADVTVAAFVLDTFLSDVLEEGFRGSHRLAQELADTAVVGMSLLELRSVLTAVLKRLRAFPLDRQHQNLLKLLLMQVWSNLETDSRKGFVRRLDDNANFVKAEVAIKDPVVRQMDLEEILHMWPSVHAGQEDGWEKEFAKDVLTKRHWSNWKPSPKQLRIIRKMYSDWLADLAGPKEVIE